MKILHVLDHSIPLHSGYTFRTRAILREQRKLGWLTAHLTSEKQGKTASSKDIIDGLEFYRTPVSTGFLSKLPVLNQWEVVRSLTKRLEEVAENEKPDVIHAHSPVLNGLAAIKVGKKLGIPVVYEVRAFWEDAAVDHGTNKEGDLRYRLTRYLETKVFKQADAITCICEGLKRDIIDRGVDKTKITIIPNAVDLDQFQIIDQRNAKLASSLGLKETFTIGFIGSFYAYEGLDLLINAVSQLIKSGMNINCVMVGGGPQEENLKQQVKRLGLSNNVIFTGRVPHAEISDYYSIIDLLVYPRISKRITELVTPLKPLEAMAQGRMFVASNVGGHHELIEHAVTGLLFEKNQLDSLVSVIEKFSQNSWDNSVLLENGRDYVSSTRNWANSVARYRSVYEALIR